MHRRDFLNLLAGSAATAALTPLTRSATAARQTDRPNLVLIMSDDHASHALSCYGSKINKTPHLDRIADEGMRFTNCFCTNSICAPSRAVILTGKYSHLNGVVDNGRRLDGSQQTFPKLLQQAGYQTALIGKWHLQSDPTGFDYWNILPGQGVYHNPPMIERGQRRQYQGYVSDVITDLSLDWLQKRDPNKPFCLLYWHKAPHRNWQPAERYKDLYEEVDLPLPETFDDDYATRSDAARQQEMTIERHLTKGDLKQDPPAELEGAALKRWKYQRYLKDYLRCVASVDDNVGRMLKYLDETGLAENTVVAYTSDQGFYLGDHGWFDKRFMYEESLRMPLLIRYPKAIKPGTVSDDLVLNLDFAPALLDLAGVQPPADMQGRSFRAVLEGRTPADWRTSMYYHYYEYPAVHAVKRHYGVRTRRHKLIHFYYDLDAWELYDLEKDPHELHNVYDDPANAQLLADLKAELERLRKQYGDSDDNMQQFLPAKAKGG
jgi:arylsulfatase A-like enzyme